MKATKLLFVKKKSPLYFSQSNSYNILMTLNNLPTFNTYWKAIFIQI